MDKNIETQCNQAKLVGEVVSEVIFSHEVFGEGFYTFDIQVKRLSEAVDIINVTLSDRLVENPAQNIVIGTKLSVTGQLRSYNNYTTDITKNKLVLTVFARDVEIIESDEFRSSNEICINAFICKAPMYRVTPFGREISDILVAVNRTYNKSDYIPCIAWGRNAKFVSKLDIGENVIIWGRVQSRAYQKKLENGEVVDKVAYELSITKIEKNKVVEKN